MTFASQCPARISTMDPEIKELIEGLGGMEEPIQDAYLEMITNRAEEKGTSFFNFIKSWKERNDPKATYGSLICELTEIREKCKYSIETICEILLRNESEGALNVVGPFQDS